MLATKPEEEEKARLIDELWREREALIARAGSTNLHGLPLAKAGALYFAAISLGIAAAENR